MLSQAITNELEKHGHYTTPGNTKVWGPNPPIFIWDPKDHSTGLGYVYINDNNDTILLYQHDERRNYGTQRSTYYTKNDPQLITKIIQRLTESL